MREDCRTGNKENHILFIIASDLGTQKTSTQHILVNLL